MKAKITKLDFVGTKVLPTFGGQTIEVEYYIETVQYGIKNNYTVFARVAGLSDGSIWLEPTSYEAHNNNENTLIESAIFDLFEEHIH